MALLDSNMENEILFASKRLLNCSVEIDHQRKSIQRIVEYMGSVIINDTINKYVSFCRNHTTILVEQSRLLYDYSILIKKIISGNNDIVDICDKAFIGKITIDDTELKEGVPPIDLDQKLKILCPIEQIKSTQNSLKEIVHDISTTLAMEKKMIELISHCVDSDIINRNSQYIYWSVVQINKFVTGLDMILYELKKLISYIETPQTIENPFDGKRGKWGI